MKLLRRHFLHSTAGVGAILTIPPAAQAQSPSRPARVMYLSRPAAAPTPWRVCSDNGFWSDWGQPFIVENGPGAGTNTGTETVVHASPDGYTLLVSTPPSAINDILKFEFIRDIAPICAVMRSPFVMVVNPSIPALTVPEFIAYAKINSARSAWRRPGSG